VGRDLLPARAPLRRPTTERDEPRPRAGAGLRAVSGSTFLASDSGASVQLRGSTPVRSADEIHAFAARGVETAASQLPFLAEIQRSFGPAHDLRGVLAHSDPDARATARAMQSEAYATGEHVIFGAPPTLFTAAHEAAHVIQQRGGLELPRGIGRPGDRHEQLADRVASQVVRGESAATLLGPPRAAGPAPPGRVQGEGGLRPDEELSVSERFDREYARRRRAYDDKSMAELGLSAPVKTWDDLRRFSAAIDAKDLRGKLRKSAVGDGAMTGGDAAAIRARRSAATTELGEAMAALANKKTATIGKSLTRLFKGTPVPGFTANDGAGVPPRGSVAIITKGGVFLGAEVVVDGAASDEGERQILTLRTFSLYSMGTPASKMKTKERIADPADPKGAQVLGWFAPDDLPDLPKKQQRVPYDFTAHESDLPQAELDEEIDRLLYIGQMAAGANWHADGSEMIAVETVQVDTGRKKKNGDPIFETQDTGKGKKIANTQKTDADRFGLARLIMNSDPNTERWNTETLEKKSIFTTCIATSAFIVRTYLGEELNAEFTRYSGIGGVMSPIYDVKVGDRLMREGEAFKYLQASGAYVPRDPTSDRRFELAKGDVYMTGTFESGAWTFQHYSLVAEVKPRADGLVDLITVDGGQGDSRAGEDKTGFTQRTYDPATGIISGARPKEVIGVWKLPVLRRALQGMPPEVKATLAAPAKK